MEQIKSLLESLDAKIWAAIIAAGVSTIFGILNYFFNRKMLKEKKIEEKRKEVYKKLNDFYGPFQAYLNKSTELYKLFSEGKPKGFRTLTYLMDREQEYEENGKKFKVVLTDIEEKLLEEIVSIGEKLEDLIVNKAGLIDDKELRYDYKPDKTITDIRLNKIENVHETVGLLNLASTHYRLMSMAFKGTLKGKGLIENIRNYIFPREIHQKIESSIVRLQQELEKLNN